MDKILTLHPEGKAGVNISVEKYNLIKEIILSILTDHPGSTFSEINSISIDKLDGKFEGSISWYCEHVKLDLEARGIILREKKGKRMEMRINEKK